MTITGSKVICESTYGNKQHWLGIQYGAMKNVITVNNTEIVNGEGVDCLQDYIIINKLTDNAAETFDVEGVSIVVDGVELPNEPTSGDAN